MANDRMTAASPEPDGNLGAAYKQTATAAAAIASSLLMYIIVVEVLLRAQSGAAPPAFLGTLRVVLFVSAGVVIFMTTILKGIMLRGAPADAAARVARLRVATMTAVALSEVPVVSGLVLIILGSARADFYMLLAISAYMMVRHFPRRGSWEEYARRGHTAVR